MAPKRHRVRSNVTVVLLVLLLVGLLAFAHAMRLYLRATEVHDEMGSKGANRHGIEALLHKFEENEKGTLAMIVTRDHDKPTTAKPTSAGRPEIVNQTDVHELKTQSKPSYKLDMRKQTLHKKACPLPILQPEKYNKKFGWGEPVEGVNTCLERKNERFLKKARERLSIRHEHGIDAPNARAEFEAEWGARNRFSSIIESRMSAGEAEVEFHTSLCRENGVVWEFDEMEDSAFQRMSSTLDAEDRQNWLKGKFSIEGFDDHTTERHPDFVKRANRAGVNGGRVRNLTSPYLIARCEAESEVYVRAPFRSATNGKWEQLTPQTTQNENLGTAHRGLKNVLHIMFDSTSIHAQRRASKRVMRFLEKLNNAEDANVSSRSPSYVFPFHHYHAVGCCSPGNQIPMYSGNMNGEGDPFVKAEPHTNSKDWIWNIAEKNGFKTFWTLDNCPDKSARDYHAFPSVHSRVVAPICIAGPLLSQRTLGCVGDKSVDEIAIASLDSFWRQHENDKKFAMAHFISPHEPTEKLLIELDKIIARYLEKLEARGALEDTAIILWSDHGINFGPYASTPDGEIEKLFPFANVILPRSFVEQAGFYPQLRHNMDMLTTPFDLYELTRRLLYFPSQPPPFAHDPSNPPLPSPEESHIMASFRSPVTPIDPTQFNISEKRHCATANIPVEFCTCIPWRPLPIDGHQKEERESPPEIRSLNQQIAFSNSEIQSSSFFASLALEAHNNILKPYFNKTIGFPFGQCSPMRLRKVNSFEIQRWPIEYQPKTKRSAKKIWARPNRDIIRIVYEASGVNIDSHGTFLAVFGILQKTPREGVELIRIDRLDSMEEKRCGVKDKIGDHLCICRIEEN